MAGRPRAPHTGSPHPCLTLAGSIWPETEPVGTRLPAGAHTTFSRFPPNAVPRRAVTARAASAAIPCFTGVQDTGGHSAGVCRTQGTTGWVVGSGRETGPRLKYALLLALLTVALAGA